MKNNTQQPESTSILTKQDEALAIHHTPYKILWKYNRECTKRINRIVKEVISKFEIFKIAIYKTTNMSKNTLESYLNIPDNYILTGVAKERMAVAIALVVPDIVIQMREENAKEKKVSMHYRHIFGNDSELEDFTKRYIKAFGDFGEFIVHQIKNREELLELNRYYYDIFTKHTNKIL